METTSEPPALIIPVIHLNGTSRERLVDAVTTVLGHLREARLAMREMSPNGRDYYTAPGRMELAVDQHWRWMKEADELISELDEYACAISDA